MVIVLTPGAKEEEVAVLREVLQEAGCEVWPTKGAFQDILGLVDETHKVDREQVMSFRCVEKVLAVQDPYKKANRLFHPLDTAIRVGNSRIGGGGLAVIAGPCSVESEEQIVGIAKQVQASGATFLRGGAYKPRSSPYSFQGMQEEGLELLKLARKATGLPIVSELVSTDQLDRFVDDVDVIQIGTRNMQNYELLKAVGEVNKPVLLKRGLSSTIEEWLMSAEYIMAGGNEQVILCERGIRTFETYTRNTLDLSAVLAVKHLSHLPVVVDPSHAAGMWWMVEALSKAAVAVGADGLMIEVHNEPERARCDGAQSLKPERFDRLMGQLQRLSALEESAM